MNMGSRASRLKKKPRRIVLRYRKNDPAHNVQVAVVAWLKARGGDAIVVGGIGIMDQGPYRFQVCVGITGTAPVKKVDK